MTLSIATPRVAERVAAGELVSAVRVVWARFSSPVMMRDSTLLMPVESLLRVDVSGSSLILNVTSKALTLNMLARFFFSLSAGDGFPAISVASSRLMMKETTAINLESPPGNSGKYGCGDGDGGINGNGDDGTDGR